MRLSDLDVTPGPHHRRLVEAVRSSAREVHAHLGLPPPVDLDDDAGLVVAAEQLGVELRPATLYKLMILDALGARGHHAVFMFEERDVASKDKRLRGWGIPDATSPEGVRRISPVEKSATKKAMEHRPLAHVPVTPDYARARLQLLTHYQPLVDAGSYRRLDALVSSLLSSLAGAAGSATTLAELGQRQLAHVARAMGIRHVTFCNTAAVEEHVIDREPEILHALPMRELVDAGLHPADSAAFWGVHLGECSGRARVSRDGRADCLRCGAALAPASWKPFSLRASVRMLVMRELGIDLFVVGGKSGYNDGIREFCQQRGESYLPLAWQKAMPYCGPAQRGNPDLLESTAGGAASLVDALIALCHEDPRGCFFVSSLENPAQGAFDLVASTMRGWLAERGVYYAAGTLPSLVRADAAMGVVA